MNKNETPIKEAIVDAYRRGVCDHNGVTLPKHKRGMAGKGSHFRPRASELYRRNYEKIEW